MYRNIDIESSYKKNNLGKTLYDLIIKHKPLKVVEFGSLYGYSTIAMAMALKDLGKGKITSYDIWDKYQYKHTTISVAEQNVYDYGVSGYVEFKDLDYWKWLESPAEFDFLHLDISNTGEIIFNTYSKLTKYIQKGSILAFEGGSILRDKEEWMVKYQKTPINSVKTLTNYKVVNPLWPSISIIKNNE